MVGHVVGVWRYRFFWLSLVKMDLMTRYRKSVLGIGWSLIYPLAMTTVLLAVFGTIMKSATMDWRKYALSVLSAMTVWEFLRGCMTQGCFSLIRSEAYIRQAPLPFAIYSLRVVLGNAFHLMMSSTVLLVLLLILHPTGLTANAFVAIPGLLLAMVFGWAIATLAGFATAFFHDISHMTEVFAQMMFFLTPIFYSKEQLKEYAWTTEVNPFALFIELVREPLVSGAIPSTQVYMSAGIFTAAALALAIGAIAWLQKKVIFQL